MSNKTHVALAILTVLSAAASAQEATPDTWMTEHKPSLSRAEVHAELARARIGGELAPMDNEGYLPMLASSTPRAVIVAETRRARATGELAMLQAEAYDHMVPWMAQHDSARITRMAQR